MSAPSKTRPGFETGRLPMPSPSMYHLVRAMHMTAKCVACRECEETCPADIPMAVQFRLIARDVKEMFNYETGADHGTETAATAGA